MMLGALLALSLSVPPPQHAEDALHRSFLQAQGARFTVLFEGPQDEALATRAIEVLEQAYEHIAVTLGTFPHRPLVVILYTQQQFEDITRAPAWAAAAYDGRIRVPVRGALERPAELQRVLSHELAHALIESIAPRGVPVWLAEGIAATFEPDGGSRHEAELAQTPRRIAYDRLTRSFRDLSPEDARLAYAQSAAMARLLFAEGGGPTVAAILRDLASGASFPDAFERRLALPFDWFLRTLGPDR